MNERQELERRPHVAVRSGEQSLTDYTRSKQVNTQDTILNHIPPTGATAKDLVLSTGLNDTTIRRQLKTLEEAGTLRKERVDNSTRWFEQGTSDESKAATTPSKPTDVADRDRLVLELLVAEGPVGISKAAVAERLNIATDHAYLSLWRLNKQGKAAPTGERDGRSPRWRAL